MSLCKDCCHFAPLGLEDSPLLGTCSRWLRGYSVGILDIPVNEVLIEDDEGWANMVGPEFGCTLWEMKT